MPLHELRCALRGPVVLFGDVFEAALTDAGELGPSAVAVVESFVQDCSEFGSARITRSYGPSFEPERGKRALDQGASATFP
jgi:hypothetical protein